MRRLGVVALEKVAHMAGYALLPLTQNHYIGAAETLREARRRGQSVCEYVESIWDQQGATARVVEEMAKAGCLTSCSRILEIGPGTGRYLEAVLRHVSPHQYDVYETAEDWAAWLARTYGSVVVRQPADGRTLRHTPSHSCGLVHAHGVFVYIPFLQVFEYFEEMSRVCASGGHVVFDCFADEQFDSTVIGRWLASTDRYPVILPRTIVLNYFSDRGFTLIREFDAKYGHGHSRYMIFQRSV
jgi:phospholipid N-methyltransferase